MSYFTPGKTREMAQRDYTLAALSYFSGNKAQTARALDISERTLYADLERYAVDDGIREKRIAAIRARDEAYLLRARGKAPQAETPAPAPASAASKEPPAATPFLDPDAGRFLDNHAGDPKPTPELVPASCAPSGPMDEPAPQEPIEEGPHAQNDAALNVDIVEESDEPAQASGPHPKAPKRRGNPGLQARGR